MKKILSLVLCAALAASLLTGCSSNLPKGYSPFGKGGETTATGALKTGLAVISSAAKSVAPADGKNGTAQMDSTVVAVLVDSNGVIVDCKIDGVQTKVEYDAAGKIVTSLDTKIPTKNELGTGYGMGKASSIGKEWNEQAAALAAYVIGKTVDEVKGIAMDETTKPTDPELSSSVTISIGGFIPAIEKAVTNAQELGAQTGDKLGLGIDTNISKSKDAATDKDGLAQAYSIYTASSFDASGKITSCVLDGSQTNVNFNAKGEITSDINAAVATKNELKEDYGMKGSSSIGKEWYEQAAAYAAYVTGKTLAEVNGVALDESGHPTGADLAASVTVSVGAFNACLERAAKDAGFASAPATGALKTGLAIMGDAAKSKAPADGKNGTAQMDTTVVAVLVDSNGVIVDCKIDGVQTKVEYDATGKIVTSLDTKIPTKNELGTGYGMGKASSIGKEWNEQAAALAAYVIGKTVDEVKGVAMDETTKPTDPELTSSVTISIGGILPVIEKAVANAQELGAQTGDKLGLGVDTNISKSKDAAADKDGQAQAYSMYTASSFDASGKITSCVLDGSQTNVNFNAKGEITSDINASVQSKNELKEDYGMKGASSIGLEWYQQAANYASYVTGKTLAEVNGIAVDETGHATSADLTSSVTVSIGAFNACLERAAQNAGAGSSVAGALKTGLAIMGDAAKSKAPADGKNGTAQMDTTVVAVLVDANGVIVDCKIDGVQTKVEYDATGKIVTPLDTKIPTKNELGTGYGMGKASSIGKEWNEQAQALAAYVIGKTVDEVKGVAMDETTKPTDAELSSSVTISIGGILPVIEKAVANAQELGAQTGDKLGLGVDTNISKSKDAAADADGLAQAYSMYTAASFDASGKITSCVLDGSQTNVNFNSKGELTSDTGAAVQSKKELKDAYGMKKASSIGKEWYEQAAAYAAYVTGKTPAEVNGVAMDESGHATGADLTASVTVSIGAFNNCLDRAAKSAG